MLSITEPRVSLQRVVPLVVASVFVGVAFWLPLRNELRNHIVHVTALFAQSVRTDVADEIRAQMLAQMRLAQLWSRDQKLAETHIQTQATLFMRHHPGCLSLQVLDADHEHPWSVTLPGQEEYQNIRLLTPDQLAHALKYFAANPEADPLVVSPGIRGNGRTTRAVIAPIFMDGDARGVLVALFDERRNLQTVLEDHNDLGYGISISDGQEVIYRIPSDSRNEAAGFAQDAALPMAALTWRVRVWPESNFVNSVQSNLPLLAFAAGTLISLLLFIALDFARTSHQRGRALHLSQERLHGIVSSAMDAIITVDENQKIIVFNAAAEEMFRCKSSDVIGKQIDAFIPTRFREIHRQHIRQFAETGITERSMSPADLWALRTDGEEFPIEASISQVKTDSEQLYTVIVRDISVRRQNEEALRSANLELEARVRDRTAQLQDSNRRLEAEIQERKEAEQSLRGLSRQLLRLRDEEQRRIARELHDSTVQTLGAVAIDLDKLKKILQYPDQRTNRLLTESADLVDKSIAELRTMSYLLHPPILDDLGLEEVLPWYIAGFSSRSGIQVAADVQSTIGRLPHEIEVTIFRVLQEALTNIHRHSGSTRAELRLHRTEQSVSLEINDNGHGIWPEDLQGERKAVVGVGIAGMRERVRQLGGQFEVISGREGTLVRAVLYVEPTSRELEDKSRDLTTPGVS